MSSISLEEVVRHFRQTAPTAVRIEEELSQQLGVEVVEVSSSEESSEEVEIILEKSTAGPVVGSSCDNSGWIILASVSSSISSLHSLHFRLQL